MTTWIYGAVHLCDVSLKDEVVTYWQKLADLYRVGIGTEHPYLEDIDPTVAKLWSDSSWMTFYVSDQVSDGSTSDFFIQAAQHAEEIIKSKQKNLTAFTVWPRVPEWRFLATMLSHECITEIYFIVEDASGDVADTEQVEDRSLPHMLDELWTNYIYLSSEDAVLYHVDYSKTPL